MFVVARQCDVRPGSEAVCWGAYGDQIVTEIAKMARGCSSRGRYPSIGATTRTDPFCQFVCICKAEDLLPGKKPIVDDGTVLEAPKFNHDYDNASYEYEYKEDALTIDPLDEIVDGKTVRECLLMYERAQQDKSDCELQASDPKKPGYFSRAHMRAAKKAWADRLLSLRDDAVAKKKAEELSVQPEYEEYE
jgi:hypothetical protein